MLKLGDYVWPNDPETLRISYARKVDMELTEDGLYSITNLGRFGRTFEGEGAFYGENAYDSFRELAKFLYSGTAKEFLHPKWDKATVLLTELEVTEECQNNFLRYKFKMVETLS